MVVGHLRDPRTSTREYVEFFVNEPKKRWIRSDHPGAEGMAAGPFPAPRRYLPVQLASHGFLRRCDGRVITDSKSFEGVAQRAEDHRHDTPGRRIALPYLAR